MTDEEKVQSGREKLEAQRNRVNKIKRKSVVSLYSIFNYLLGPKPIKSTKMSSRDTITCSEIFLNFMNWVFRAVRGGGGEIKQSEKRS